MKRASLFLTIFAASALFGCGGDTLTGVTEVTLANYPAGQAFRLTAIMTACSDSCSTYEEAECSVDVNEEDRTITLDASACFERTMDDCAELCGPRILAHCEVPALTSGTYTVQSGVFARTITVE